MLSPLANPVFRRMFAAQVVALAGTGLTTVALALLAYDLSGGEAGAVLGTALALKMVAYVAIAPLAGAWADRLPRRAMLVALDIGRAAVVLCLPFVDAVWQIYVLIFVLSACSAGFTPTFQATIPDILPDEARYTRALSLSRLAYDLENLLSPTAAALLLAVVSYDALFAANGLAFVFSAAMILSTRLPAAGPSERPRDAWANLTFGVRAYLATPRLRGLLMLSFAAAAGGAMIIVNTVVYVRYVLGGDATDTAIALAAAGGGSMTAALILPRVLDRTGARPAMLAGGALMALALALATGRPGFHGLLLLWFLAGAGSSLIQTPAGRLLAASSRPSDRPAYFSAQFALSHAGWLITYLLAGWLATRWGLTVTVGVLAAIVVAATAAAAMLWPRGETAELEHHHPAHDHEHLHLHDEHHQHEHEGWEGPEPHAHPHRHGALRHRHPFVVDAHHPRWPD